MKNEKKYLGKKKKKEGNNESEENFLEKKENENDDKKDNNNILNSNNNENMNNDSIKNDTNNNSILISKKDSPTQLYTFNKNTSIKEENENETKRQNEKLNSSVNKSSAIENSLQKNQINNTIGSKYKNTNSAFSENSDDYSSSSPRNHRGSQSKTAHAQVSSPKFKSHLQNSRNTAFGLKEISKRVMDIIKQNGQTTYRDISDQIVNEIKEKSPKDEKNIRRRIYDSLNVMKSMNLFNKDSQSKTIMWNYDQEFDPLNETENKNEIDDKNKIDSNNIVELKKSIKEKKEKVVLLSKELQGLKNVLERNRREDQNIPMGEKLFFPFIIIEFPSNIDPKINIALNENKTKAHFGFDEGNEMYGDLDAVSKIGNHPKFLK